MSFSPSVSSTVHVCVLMCVSFPPLPARRSFCKTAVPQEITDALERVKDDDDAVKQYGIDLGIAMCRRLLEAGTPGLHFYTLNLERSVAQILEG